MNTEKILESLSEAKESHQQWLDFGLELLNGTDLIQAQQPVRCTECDFGLWYYAEVDNLRTISGFQKIELLHADFHHQYDLLFTHAHEAHKPRLFGNRKLRQCLEEDYLKLENFSILLVKALEDIEQKLSTTTFKEQHKP